MSIGTIATYLYKSWEIQQSKVKSSRQRLHRFYHLLLRDRKTKEISTCMLGLAWKVGKRKGGSNLDYLSTIQRPPKVIERTNISID